MLSWDQYARKAVKTLGIVAHFWTFVGRRFKRFSGWRLLMKAHQANVTQLAHVFLKWNVIREVEDDLARYGGGALHARLKTNGGRVTCMQLRREESACYASRIWRRHMKSDNPQSGIQLI